MVKLTGLEIQIAGTLSIKFTLPAEYPDVAPLIEIPLRTNILSPEQHHHVIQHLVNTAKENTGVAMIYTLVDTAKEWLNENYVCQSESPAPTEHEDTTVPESKESVCIPDAKEHGGRWDFVIGLVGKPSAGKSTFFNAATTVDQAKTGSHPFTTIEPNIGKAFYGIPCPCVRLSMQDKCTAAHGHSWQGQRQIPVLLKDVAGLVPGACQGRGRGNRFLNDLCDADVLIHVIDASGCTDEKGDVTADYDPTLDVVWLQQELHHWIYDNIMEKWLIIKRRPLKLIEMFTGYHANKAIIHAAFKSAGIGNKELSNISNWDENVLKDLVTNFLRIRFPMYLVLNKADHPSAQQNIQKIKAQFPDVPCLEVSALSEYELQKHWRDSGIAYLFGDSSFKVVGDLDIGIHTRLGDISVNVLNKYGSTNVHRALNEAVALRAPSYAFPVADLDTLASIDKYRGEEPGHLRDCISLKPATTVIELYTVMSHYPILLVDGDFIRAECIDITNKRRIMKKDENVNSTNNIVKIITNRKISRVKLRDS